MSTTTINPPAEWRASLARDRNGTLTNTSNNVALVLTNHEDLVGKYRLNAFSSEVCSYTDAAQSDGAGRPIQDTDYTRLRNWFSATMRMEVSEPEIARQITLVAATRVFNPLVEYLDSIKWDGTPRLKTWLQTYMNATPGADAPDGPTDEEYLQAVGMRWAISAVARAKDPGCKVDTVLILEGLQGAGKSSALRKLAGDAFFVDTPIDIGDRDGRMIINRAWIVELAELESLRKSEVTRTKAFIAQSEDHYRPPYGRSVVAQKRHCVFVGTSNKENYLQDETGNRRFWPVRCGAVDLAALERDRDQIWAEARTLYEAGEPWWLTAEEFELAERETAERVEEDSWQGTVEEWLTKTGTMVTTREEVLVHALDMDLKGFNNQAAVRLGRIMAALGYENRQQRLEAGRRRRFYVRCGEEGLLKTLALDALTRQAAAIRIAKLPKYERDLETSKAASGPVSRA